MADHEVFEVPNFVLQKGAMLPVARLAYKTVGALNAARDNAGGGVGGSVPPGLAYQIN
jgi:homoserine acetyltransferase